MVNRTHRPEDKESDCPELGAGWKVLEKYCWLPDKKCWRCYRYYFSPDNQKFRSLKQAKAYLKGKTEEPKKRKLSARLRKKKDTSGAITLKDLDATPLPPFESSSTSGSSMDIDCAVDGDDGAKSKKGERKRKRGKEEDKEEDCRDVFIFGSGENSTQTSRENNNVEQQKVKRQRQGEKDCQPLQAPPVQPLQYSDELLRMIGTHCMRGVSKEIVDDARARCDGTVGSFLTALLPELQEFTKVETSKKASPAKAVDSTPVQVSNSFDVFDADVYVPSSVSTRKKKNKSKATVATETVVSSDSSSSGSLSRDQETLQNEEMRKEESEQERKSRLFAENKEKMEGDRERREIKEQKKKEQREKALQEKALKEKEQMDNADMSKGEMVDSGLSSSPDHSKVSSDNMSNLSSVDSGVLSPTVSKVSSEEGSSSKERPTSSQIEEMEAKMAIMQAKMKKQEETMKEQEETITRLKSSSVQSQSSTVQETELGMFEKNEFVNRLSTSAEKLNDHLSNKGKMFDAHLSAQGEKFTASLETELGNQKDSDGDNAMDVDVLCGTSSVPSPVHEKDNEKELSQQCDVEMEDATTVEDEETEPISFQGMGYQAKLSRPTASCTHTRRQQIALLNNLWYEIQSTTNEKYKAYLEGEVNAILTALDASDHTGEKLLDISALSLIDNGLLERLTREGKEVKVMSSDGGCLFHSLSDQLGLGEDGHLLLRAMACDHLAANRDRYKDYITGDFDRYVEKMRQPHEYADHPEIKAMSEVLGVEIIIHEYGDRKPTVIIGEGVDPDNHQSLVICRRFGNHYDSVWPRNSHRVRHAAADIVDAYGLQYQEYTSSIETTTSIDIAESIDISDDLKLYEKAEQKRSTSTRRRSNRKQANKTPADGNTSSQTDDMVECMTAMKEGRYDDAIRLASDIISSTPTSKWYHIRGLAHQALGNFKDAFNDYNHAESLNPTDNIKKVLNVRGGECLEKLKDFNLFELISDSTVPPESLKNFAKNDILKARRFFEQDNLENLAKTTLGNMNRFIPATTRSASTNYTRCGVIGSFPVTDQHAEEHGPLYSRGRNVIPQGPTPFEFFRAMRVLLMQHHGISSELANIIAMHSFVWLDFVPFTLEKDASTKGVDHQNYEKLKKDCEEVVIKYISDVAAQLHLTHIMVIGRHAKEFVEKHRDKLFSSEVKVYYCLHPSKMSMGASNHEVFDALTSINKMIYDLRGEEYKPVSIELMENNFQTYIRDNLFGKGGSDEFVYVGERDGVPILYERSRTAFEKLLSDKDAFHSHIPNQATIQSNMEKGTPTHFAGLDIKIYKFDSKDAPSLEFGAQTKNPKYHEWNDCSEKSCRSSIYVARYGPDNVITHYASGCRQLMDMIRKTTAFDDHDFPTQAEFESGKGKEIAGLKIEMYAFDSKEAVKLRDMEPGAQTGTPQYEEWEEKVKRPQLFAHTVDLDTLKVVSVIGKPVSTLIGLKECGNISITENDTKTINKELKKIELKFGRGRSWFDYDKAMDSIDAGLSLLIWLRVKKQVPGCNVIRRSSGDIYHLPFILSGVQLKPGREATVKCEEVGVLALDEEDFKADVDKLKVLPKNKRLQYKDSTNKCCKIEGCTKVERAGKDHLCNGHYNQFKEAGRDTTEGEESENRELTDDEKRMKEALAQKWNGMGKDDLCDEIENIYNTFDPRQILFNSKTRNLSNKDTRNRLLKWLRDYPLSFLSLGADEDTDEDSEEEAYENVE